MIFREPELFIFYKSKLQYFVLSDYFAEWKRIIFNEIASRTLSVLSSSFLNEAKQYLSVNYSFVSDSFVKMPDKRKDSMTSSGKNSKRAKVEEPDTENISYDPVHFIR